MPIVIFAGAEIFESREDIPESRAAAKVTTLKVEPGAYSVCVLLSSN